jgi:hypothetical protein
MIVVPSPVEIDDVRMAEVAIGIVAATEVPEVHLRHCVRPIVGDVGRIQIETSRGTTALDRPLRTAELSRGSEILGMGVTNVIEPSSSVLMVTTYGCLGRVTDDESVGPL